jgi:ankyrin repeat protein
VYFEDAEMVRLLVELGADLNIPLPDYGDRPLHTAAMVRSLEMTQLLAERGADLHAENKEGSSPFRLAIVHGATEVVRFYLENGFDINEKDSSGWTPLHAAAYNHGPMQFLLSLGADVNARDIGDKTPLHNAMVLYEKKETVDLLLNAGADINAIGTNGHTPLVTALLKGNFYNARYLIEAGADVNIGKGFGGEPPIAIAGGELELVLMMVERGADLKVKDREGRGLLHTLVTKSKAGTYDAQTVEYFLQQGLEVDALDNDGRTPLYHAIESKRYDCIKLLLENGADINIEDKRQTRPIEYAYDRDNRTAMKLLLDSGAVADPEHEKNRKSRITTTGKPSYEETLRELGQ